jgi:plastocyanin
MTNRLRSQLRFTLRFCSLLIALLLPFSAVADTWQLQVGAQKGNKAHQALAFLPNEIWIHSGDSITWTFGVNEIHTVTFLTPLQLRPSRLVGCLAGGLPDGRTPDFSVYDGTACVNSGVLSNSSVLSTPPTYTVVFTPTGNFKLVCLAHPNMTATVHVLLLSTPLPHDQDFYDKQGDRQRDNLLSDDMESHHHSGSNDVIAGVGHVVGTGGGTQTLSVNRFMNATKVIHVGETVEWTTGEAVTNHTITFGPEPDPINQIPPSANVTTDADGARHAVISSPLDAVHSGFITQSPQDRTGLAQAPLSASRFRVTFTQPGIYQYKCVLHDELGMVGTVVVLPN